MSLGRKLRIKKADKVRRLSLFFIKHKKLMKEAEYEQVSRLEKPMRLPQLKSLFGNYEEMLQCLESGPYSSQIKALKPKPVIKPKAPAIPKKVEPAKAEESKDE